LEDSHAVSLRALSNWKKKLDRAAAVFLCDGNLVSIPRNFFSFVEVFQKSGEVSAVILL